MIWILPSVIGLLIKSFLFLNSNIMQKKNFFYFLLATVALNIIEILAFFRFGYDLIVLKLYYSTAIILAFYLLMTCSEISNSLNFINKSIVFALVCSFSIITLSTNTIVEGYSVLPNNSITRIAGPYYIVFQLYVLIFMVTSLVILARRAIREKGSVLKYQCIIALLAFSPLILMVIGIISLMQLGYKVNMAGFLSITTCCMLFAFILLMDKSKLFNLMRFIPFSQERAFYLSVNELMIKFSLTASGESVDMKAVFKELEELVIKNTNQYFDTQKEVARILKVSESTLSRKLPKKTS